MYMNDKGCTLLPIVWNKNYYYYYVYFFLNQISVHHNSVHMTSVYYNRIYLYNRHYLSTILIWVYNLQVNFQDLNFSLDQFFFKLIYL